VCSSDLLCLTWRSVYRGSLPHDPRHQCLVLRLGHLRTSVLESRLRTWCRLALPRATAVRGDEGRDEHLELVDDGGQLIVRRAPADQWGCVLGLLASGGLQDGLDVLGVQGDVGGEPGGLWERAAPAQDAVML